MYLEKYMRHETIRADRFDLQFAGHVITSLTNDTVPEIFVVAALLDILEGRAGMVESAQKRFNWLTDDGS
jgi:hypothetical protein